MEALIPSQAQVFCTHTPILFCQTSGFSTVLPKQHCLAINVNKLRRKHHLHILLLWVLQMEGQQGGRKRETTSPLLPKIGAKASTTICHFGAHFRLADHARHCCHAAQDSILLSNSGLLWKYKGIHTMYTAPSNVHTFTRMHAHLATLAIPLSSVLYKK